MKFTIAAIAATASIATPALADVVFDRFGALPQTEFGGDGIPNDRVAVSNVSFGGVTGEIGITATQRSQNAPGTLFSDGVFGYEAGTNNGVPGQAGNRSKWNFSFYADPIPGVSFQVLYDFDPSAATDYGQLPIELFLKPSGAIEDSQNATFDYLNDGVPGVVIPPSMFDFDADANGIYNFRIQALDSATGALLTEAAIDVLVGLEPLAEVPAPAAFGLFGLGLLGLGLRRRRV